MPCIRRELAGDFTIGGSGSSPKAKVNKSPTLVKQFEDCQRDAGSLGQQLARAAALIASEDETISLLRSRLSQPN